MFSSLSLCVHLLGHHVIHVQLNLLGHHVIHVQLAVTLCALGHAVFGARISLCNKSKRSWPAVHSRTSSRPSKRSRQDDKKLQGGGKLQKLQQDSGDELRQEGDELQQNSGDALQQEAGDELQQEVGDVDLKVTLFGGAHTTCLFGSALVLSMRCLESGKALGRIEWEDLHCPLTRSWLVTATPPASSCRNGPTGRSSWRFRATC